MIDGLLTEARLQLVCDIRDLMRAYSSEPTSFLHLKQMRTAVADLCEELLKYAPSPQAEGTVWHTLASMRNDMIKMATDKLTQSVKLKDVYRIVMGMTCAELTTFIKQIREEHTDIKSDPRNIQLLVIHEACTHRLTGDAAGMLAALVKPLKEHRDYNRICETLPMDYITFQKAMGANVGDFRKHDGAAHTAVWQSFAQSKPRQLFS